MGDMPRCPNCGKVPIVDFYTMINGNDAIFCSLKCIKEYSKNHPLWRITWICSEEEIKKKLKREWRIA